MVKTDGRVNTRPVDRSWVARKLREGFDPERIGVPSVSARLDGTYVWLDGQNRGALCRAAGHDEKAVNMKVFRGLSLEQEAELFLGLNDNRRVAPIYRFMAEYTAGRPEAVEIVGIATDQGWTISDGGAPNAIHAVAALSTVYRSSAETPGTTLRDVLRIVSESWGYSPEGVNAHLLLGLASVLNGETEAEIDHATLIRKLAAHGGGPSSILGKGRGLRDAMGCKVTEGVDQVIRGIYNSGRRGRSSRLETWNSRGSRRDPGQEKP
ncbi:hypothetical protein CFP65_3051 [Kitasatospora sp. MMS16-BH015]|uniref:DUF6551 family protein n=1 Tax=Kitasatospora sp. MMS16-BH015 TaxID=2018025 RepID=UPI000CA31ED1|nr:DUF6551 family protein [Kitasatospora sp. MMS16-BH015]AUG77861.1 hypothetical protein CFP65_3051 [Kitasatospora sp. MMS16-BH015]